MSHPHETVFLRRKWLRRLGITALALIVLGWLGYVPERRDRVFRAMPDNTPFVSEHLNLAGVWRERFDNPLLVSAMQSAGVHKVEEWADDTNIVWIVRLVSGKRSLIGWSPALGSSGASCWTGASWAGMRGPLLRAMLAVRWVPGLGRLQTTAQGTRFMYTASRKKQARGEMGQKLAFYLRENILLATLGDDPDAVRVLDWRLVHDAPLAPLFRSDPEPWRQSGKAPHRCWIEPELSPMELPLRGALEARITRFSEQEIALSLTAPRKVSDPAVSRQYHLSGRCTAADTVATAAAAALLLLPSPALHERVEQLLPGLPLLAGRPAADEDALLYLTTEALGGRVLNLAVPALTLLYPATATEVSAIDMSVVQLARASKLPLRLRQLDGQPDNRRLIDWLPKNRYLALPPEESAVVELHPGWLTLSTSLGSLEAQRRYVASTPGSWHGLLQEMIAAEGAASGLLWIDIGRTSQELQRLYALYRLGTSLGAIKTTTREADVVEATRQLLENATLRGALGVVWHTTPEELRGQLTLRNDN